MRGVCLLIFLAAAYSGSVQAGPNYSSEREALLEEAFQRGEVVSEMLIETLFDKETLVVDLCNMPRTATAEKLVTAHSAECDFEPAFFIDGVSLEGQDTLIAAAETYESFRIDMMNERARLFVAFCETGEMDPSIVAERVSDIHDTVFQSILAFYNTTMSGLSEADSAAVEAHNLLVIGVTQPTNVNFVRKIETTLASHFPEEYREDYISKCARAAENKGIPFRRFRRELYREDCQHSRHSVGPNGESISLESNRMGPGCTILEYYAQKPKMVGDRIVEDN